MRPGLDVETVIVESKLGILRDRVLVGGREIAVRRGRHGWRVVVGARGGVVRVQSDGWWDRLTIQSPFGSLEIRFQWRNTTFPWRGRIYRVGSMLGNRGTLFRGREQVAVGKITWGGVRFEMMDPEVHDIQRELALGFGLRAQAIAVAGIAGVPLLPL